MQQTTPQTADAAPIEEADGASDYRLIGLIVACALFMEQFDGTVLTTALPTIARDFGVRPPALSVTVTSYLLALAVFVPVSGYMADRFGARRVFCAAIGVFALGSLGSALTNGLEAMAAARFLQGLGGAMMMPVGRLVMLRTVPPRYMVSATSWMLVPGLLGTILGPPLGGFIVTYMHWRAIFWINLPIALLALVLVSRYIPDVRAQEPPVFDAVGFVLSAVALAALMVGFEAAGPIHAGAVALLPLGIGVVMALAYWAHARRHPAPIMDFALLRHRNFRLSWIAGSITRLLQGAQPFLLALMVQYGFGFSAARAGTITLATAVGSIVMKGLAGPVLRRLGFRRGLTLMGAAGTVVYATCGFFSPAWPEWAIWGVLVLAGFLMSFQFTAYNTIAYDGLSSEEMSRATSFYTTFQQLTLSLGVCMAATILQISTAAHGVQHPQLRDFALAFWIIAGISFTAIIPNLAFAPDAGSRLTETE